MKTPRIANAIGQIDDDLVAGAAKCKTKNKKHWLKWGSLAACFAVLVIAGAAILPSLFRENVTPEGTDGRYKDFSIRASESAIVWPWEYQTVYEKYRNVKIDGIEYHGNGRAVSETWIGESIGNYTVVGYDEVNNGKKYSAEFEAYALKDIAQSQFIAVKMEDSYYVFQNDEYAPPNTLGELMDAVNLSEVVELQRFSEGDNTPDSKRFALSSDDYVWEVLSECRNAPFVEDQTWTAGDRSYLSFTITSEALGVYKVALYVTEDGYLWTNAFNYQYLFNIGEDAASKIIKYAKENSTEAEARPFLRRDGCRRPPAVRPTPEAPAAARRRELKHNKRVCRPACIDNTPTGGSGGSTACPRRQSGHRVRHPAALWPDLEQKYLLRVFSDCQSQRLQ